MDVIEQARNILLDTSIPWLELDLDFNNDVWKQQIFEVEDYYTDYRASDSDNWKSCCLHGLDVDKTYTSDNYGYNEYCAPYVYTDLAYKTPAITNFWKSHFPAERYTRIRFMKIEAGGMIGWHNDGTLPQGIDPLNVILPINIAITQPANCEMQMEGYGVVPFKEGKSFLLNISNNHAVFNRSSKPRVHMIANIILGNRKKEFCEMLIRCYSKHYG